LFKYYNFYNYNYNKIIKYISFILIYNRENKKKYNSNVNNDIKLIIVIYNFNYYYCFIFKNRYTSLLIRTYVDDNIFLHWCPAPNCEYAIECKIHDYELQKLVPTVKCKCGNNFCFGCGLPDHQPCICSLVAKWLNKCRDDSETANWISVNTKECPRCKASIEKNGGCNHMTCKKCKNEFCWVCMGPWSEHGNQWYTCNRFEEKTSVDARDSQSKSRAKLERYTYIFYFNP